ncbi:MAG: MATE family efflux transporter [Candidatus Kapabacteria bacterium]|nr:MATE family efflux transporter [Candidatus Kapabacteria bacterium]
MRAPGEAYVCVMQEQRSTMRELIWLAIPVALSQISDMVTVMADTVMVGHVGTVDLAAATLANSVWVVAALFNLGFMVAITPKAGAAWGGGDTKDFARTVRAGTIASLLIGVALVAVLMVLAPFLQVFGAPADVTSLAIPYFMWIVASMLPRVGIAVLKQTAEAMSNTRIALSIAIVANLANIGLNWVFIYGNLGMPAMGVEGAGVATFLSRMIGLGCVVAAYRYGKTFRVLRTAMQGLATKVTWNEVGTMLRTGLPIAGQLILEGFGFATGAVMMGWLGATPLAAHQIAMNLASLTFMVSLGISSAATIMISNAVGRRDVSSVQRNGKAALIAVIVWNLFTAAVFFVFRNVLPQLYSADPAVMHIASNLLLWAALFQLFDGTQTVGLGMLRGVHDVYVPTAIAGASYALVGIPLGYAAAFHTHLGPGGIWLGYLLALALASTLYVVRYRIVVARIRVH